MRIALMGVGRMGKAVEMLAPSYGHQVVAWLDSQSHEGGLGMTAMLTSQAEVAVDFSEGAAVLDNVKAATGIGLDVVVGTTGWDDQLPDVVRAVEASGRALIHAPNFSMGMHAFSRLVQEAAAIADRLDEYDAHLSESHHRHKTDHPSGTARRLADLLISRVDRKKRWAVDLPEGAPDPSTLQVSVVRAGEEPGTHQVILDGPDDRIELIHHARGRDAFAKGALLAAEWVRGRRGVFTLDDMMADTAKADDP